MASTGLIKMCHEDAIQPGERVVKESYGRCVVLIKQAPGEFFCFELPDASFAHNNMDQIKVVPGCNVLRNYRDCDGTLWVNLPVNHKPAVDKSFKAPIEGYGLGTAVTGADVPPPLIPFAGCDRKALPPSPAKPLAPGPASPYKPSPFKERVDMATQAVVQKSLGVPEAVQGKNWGARQAKMGEFFSQKKKVVSTAPVAEPMDV